MSRSRWVDAVWLAAAAGLSSAWCATAARHVGPTFDEPAHLNAGLTAWRTGSVKQLMTWGAMPLPIDVQTLPVYIWERWRGGPFQPYSQVPDLLPVARWASLPFWWLLLWYAMRWGSLVGGRWAGRLGCALVAADPNLVGHAALATTDTCLTAAVLVATYHFAVGRDGGWGRRVLVPGLLYGVALTAKASALPYVPLLGGVFGLHHMWKEGQLGDVRRGTPRQRLAAGWAATHRLRWDLAAVMGVGLAWAFAYCGCDWVAEPTFVTWAAGRPAGRVRDVMLAVAEHLTAFPNAGEGLVQQVKHNIRGHGGAYLHGTYHPRAVWYYFPAVLAVKLPDATLLLTAAALLLRPPSCVRTPAGWAAVVLLLFSLNTRVQIGVRLVFPLVVFGYLALAAAVCRPGRLRSPLAVLAAVAIGANAGEAVLAWPDGVRYVNRLHGGSATGWRHVADSNYDWGQGVPELTAWREANGRPPVAVWYYGGDPAVLMPPYRAVHLHLFADKSPAGVRRGVGPGYLAVSVGLLTACPNRKPEVLALVDWLNGLPVAARTPTFVLFRLG